MDYDCLRLVLAWIARARVEERCENLRAFTGAGHDDNQTLDIYPCCHIMDAKGMLYEKEALLFSYELGSTFIHDFEVVQCKEQLCLYDVEFEFSEAYDNLGLFRFGYPSRPSLSWGKRKNVKFTMALCKSLSVTIIFEVFSVPRSWWVCHHLGGHLGDHWRVIEVMKEQLNADEIIAKSASCFTIDVPLSRVTHGCDIVEWIKRATDTLQPVYWQSPKERNYWESRERLVMGVL